jgi:uncharacterized low-complexity protein
MRIAIAAALALTFATTAQAAPLATKPVVQSVIETVAAKKATAGKCGTMNYFSKKSKKCVSAADKK